MGVLIKGMEMPTTCIDCPFMVSRDNDDCILQSDLANEIARTWNDLKANCPLVPVQTPHGRLGDLDKLWDRMYNYMDNEGAKMPFGYDDQLIHRDSACFMIENAPTVIEAEGKKNV